MRGIILCGGNGTRLSPLTLNTNKHLLPVFDKPMVYYPLETFTSAGITEIMIVTGPEHAGDFINLLGDGSKFGCNLTYRVQEKAGGIADALQLCEDFAGANNVAVILGDNIFDYDFEDAVTKFEETMDKESGLPLAYAGASIFLKEVPDPERFGVAEIAKDVVCEIVEKPENPTSNFAVTGIYFYDMNLWNIIRTLEPSDRGELEITDVNNAYLDNGTLSHRIIEEFWTDAGTHNSLYRASKYMNDKIKK